MNQHAKRRHQTALRYLPVEKPEPTEAAPHRLLATPEAGVRQHVVDEDAAGQRLDRYLAGLADAADEALSRTRIQSLIEEGLVTVDGRIVTDTKAKVRTAQTIAVN
ncbi:MAG: pseudouridine synthase, RluA family, partial [Hyphomicrobiales bacterium]|nr:pseudouridine synthase, RluA family [Hyphomicrobiales bacterium]